MVRVRVMVRARVREGKDSFWIHLLLSSARPTHPFLRLGNLSNKKSRKAIPSPVRGAVRETELLQPGIKKVNGIEVGGERGQPQKQK
jgi:hypothetical protein